MKKGVAQAPKIGPTSYLCKKIIFFTSWINPLPIIGTSYFQDMKETKEQANDQVFRIKIPVKVLPLASIFTKRYFKFPFR